MPVNWAISYLRARAIGRRVRRTARRLPVIYLPGILGVKLHDRRHRVDVWGDFRGILLRDPAHAGYALEENGAVATDTLHYFRIVPWLVDTLITAEIKQVLEHGLGYREGRDLFFLGHDWRRDYRHVAACLESEIHRIRSIFGPRQRVVLLGQSVANLAVRHLVRHGPAELEGAIAKWYAFGPTWRGTYNALHMLREGYYPASRRFHGFSPEDALSYPACLQLLPHDPVLLGPGGARERLDLDDVDCWVTHRLGPRSLADSPAARRTLGAQLARVREQRDGVAGSHPRDARVAQTWFAGARNRAVVAAVPHEGETLVSEKAIARLRPEMADRALAAGDDHIPLAHLAEAACGPLIRSYDSIPYGESYVLVGAPKDHRAIINHPPNLAAIAADLAEVNERN
jgi:hypothetical protein